MTPDLQRLFDLITCAEIECEEARRIVLVPGPATAVKLEAWLIAHGLDDLIEVRMSQFLPPDTIWLIDERAIEAAGNEAVQHVTREMAERMRAPTCPRCGRHGYGGRIWHQPGCSVGRILNAYAFGTSVMRPGGAFMVTGT